MGCGTGLAKFILIFFNVLFWLSGACILGVGIWLRVDKNILDILQIASVSSSGNQLDHAAYIFIGFGAFVFVVGFLGCCGAWHMNRVLLGLYIFFLMVVMIGELAAGILAAVLQSKIETELKEAMELEVKKDKFIEDPAATPLKYTAFGASVNAFQAQFGCCGVNNYTDYTVNATYWPMTVGGMSRAFPFSCCDITEGGDIRQLDPSKVVNMTQCYAMDANFFHGGGCYDKLEAEINSHSKILIGVGIGIAVLEVLVLICAIVLCCEAGRTKSHTV